MEQNTKSIFYRIIADGISKESACSYDDALEVLEYSKPDIRKVAIVKSLIIEMKNRGVSTYNIKNACVGVTSGREVKALTDLLEKFGHSTRATKKRNGLLSRIFKPK